MKIIFRVDANYEVGFGHLKRSLVLAEYLRKRWQWDILFVVGKNSQSKQFIEEKGFKVEQIEPGVSWEASNQLLQILERFSADAILVDIKDPIEDSYTRVLKNSGARVAVLDNRGKGCKYADMLFYPYTQPPDNINLEDFVGDIYEGTPYIIVGQDFIKVREKGVVRDQEREKSILVSMGGSDAKGLTIKTILALEKISDIDMATTIILGPYFSNHTKLYETLRNTKGIYHVLENPPNLAEIMAKAVVAVVSAGMSVHELAFLGIPAVVISQSREHAAYAESMAKLGLCLSLGYFEDVTEDELRDTVRRLLTDRGWRIKLSEKASNLIDGLGAQRIGEAILSELRRDKG